MVSVLPSPFRPFAALIKQVLFALSLTLVSALNYFELNFERKIVHYEVSISSKNKGSSKLINHLKPVAAAVELYPLLGLM